MLKNLLDFTENRKPKTGNPLLDFTENRKPKTENRLLMVFTENRKPKTENRLLMVFTENRKPKTENPLFKNPLFTLLAVIMFLACVAPLFMGCSTTWGKVREWAGYPKANEGEEIETVPPESQQETVMIDGKPYRAARTPTGLPTRISRNISTWRRAGKCTP